MAYMLTGNFTISWVGDGVGPFTTAAPAAPKLTQGAGGNFGNANSGAVLVPGGDAPSTANVSMACSTLATNIAAGLNANIGQIQGWANGTTQ